MARHTVVVREQTEGERLHDQVKEGMAKFIAIGLLAVVGFGMLVYGLNWIMRLIGLAILIVIVHGTYRKFKSRKR